MRCTHTLDKAGRRVSWRVLEECRVPRAPKNKGDVESKEAPKIKEMSSLKTTFTSSRIRSGSSNTFIIIYCSKTLFLSGNICEKSSCLRLKMIIFVLNEKKIFDVFDKIRHCHL